MKILVCGNDTVTASAAEAAVYDAGAVLVGPSGNALRALGLADQEQPDIAIVDLAAIDGGNGHWLAEKLAERGVELVCIGDEDFGGRMEKSSVVVAMPAHRPALAECLLGWERSAGRRQIGTDGASWLSAG